jgi:pimeloyl-ACP methyl ester carboxylesterase
MTALGVRLIGLDRPGIGRSTAKSGARILDWPDDVAEVADQLGLAHFAVEGVSGGGPFALACALRMPDRLTGCALISSVPPIALLRQAGPWSQRALWSALELLPERLDRQILLLSMRPFAKAGPTETEAILMRSAHQLGPADQRLVSSPEIRSLFVQAVVESYRQGLGANLEQAITLVKPWGFAPKEIAFERVFLWHGEQDRIMSVGPARLLARALPHCTATFYPDEGHLSLLANHADTIMNSLRE